jgi:hypothetical protein
MVNTSGRIVTRDFAIWPGVLVVELLLPPYTHTGFGASEATSVDMGVRILIFSHRYA